MLLGRRRCLRSLIPVLLLVLLGRRRYLRSLIPVLLLVLLGCHGGHWVRRLGLLPFLSTLLFCGLYRLGSSLVPVLIFTLILAGVALCCLGGLVSLLRSLLCLAKRQLRRFGDCTVRLLHNLKLDPCLLYNLG